MMTAGLVWKQQPGYTYRLDMEKGRIRGFTDGLEAVKQAVYLILATERYEHLIYSWNYGVELEELMGKPVPYAIPEIQRRITEALTQDDRITGVDNFIFETSRGKVHATFTVHTIYGDVDAEKAVTV